MPDVEIRMQRQVFTGWKSAQVYRSVESAAGGFEIKMRDPGYPRPAVPGAEVQIRVDGDPILDGYVDKITGKLSTRSLTIQGRDRTADLIDGAAGIRYEEGVVYDSVSGPPVVDTPEFLSISLGDLASELAEPFGVEISLRTSVPDLFGKFSLEPGEKAWAAIERACRMRAVLAYPSTDGQLIIASPGVNQTIQDLTEATEREAGTIKDCELVLSLADRFQVYVVRGQRPGNDDDFGDLVAAVEGRAYDAAVSRFRPLLVLAEQSVTSKAAEARAQWEATIRAARANRLKVDVRGVREFPDLDSSDLWEINKLVQVSIPTYKLEGLLLISSVRYKISDSELATELVLVRPDSYTPQELIEEDETGYDAILKEWERSGGAQIPSGRSKQ